MDSNSIPLSLDQEQAFKTVLIILERAGINFTTGKISNQIAENKTVHALIGRAGSGKTALLSSITEKMLKVGVEIISGDFEVNKNKNKRTLSVLAPTNKAANILRMRGVPATTIHRILYTPVYDPDYEKIVEWLIGERDEKPSIEGISEISLKRAWEFYSSNKSIPGALAAAGLKGSDFISGWKRREEPLDIGFIDESSMLDDDQLNDLKEIFSTLILFGDPAQLAPISQSGQMVFDKFSPDKKSILSQIHRQKSDNPILKLSNVLLDPEINFTDFEMIIKKISTEDDRIVWAQRVDVDLMSRSPVLVWRNATRIRLINAFRAVYNAPNDRLLEGEPLICDGLELPLKHRKKRIDLEARGLTKGANVIYLGPGKKTGFSRLFVVGSESPRLSAASIIKIELPNEGQPFIPFAAKMGAIFLHGSAVTIHKAQGSQWENVQVFAPDIYAAAQTNRVESDLPLWKRLAYVAITRAQEKLYWVIRSRLSKPSVSLSTSDLK